MIELAFCTEALPIRKCWGQRKVFPQGRGLEGCPPAIVILEGNLWSVQIVIPFGIGMDSRASLLLNCSGSEARETRQRTSRQRRSISGYVLNVVMRAVTYEDLLFTRMAAFDFDLPAIPATAIKPSTPLPQPLRRWPILSP
jgi:hypothetical protein